ncbi:hypothetical protein SAMN05446037_101887 [Anaerovirgula multivorans]|uniref:Uncharacterized protein n=1 Tax=Anaerovirgula multivorans TaxID=312168 RepID=A0A239GUN5_9FIRM|nr:hypothetical protein [Anaerovirgula multivorans]SNS72562.1 hypothetical protein SAMN05446037_101887 [Anaerovirgula multivorans]
MHYLLNAFLIFIIGYFAVRLAIRPLLDHLDQQEEITIDEQNSGLTKLRDIDVLDNTELEEIIALYNNKTKIKENNEKYKKYENVLNELKETGYFTEEDYLNRMTKLRKYLKVD